MKTLKEEPYIAILAFCFISVLIAFAIEYADELVNIASGVAIFLLTILLTTVLPISLIALIAQGIGRLVSRSRRK